MCLARKAKEFASPSLNITWILENVHSPETNQKETRSSVRNKGPGGNLAKEKLVSGLSGKPRVPHP